MPAKVSTPKVEPDLRYWHLRLLIHHVHIIAILSTFFTNDIFFSMYNSLNKRVKSSPFN